MTVGSMIVKRDPPMKCSRCEHEIPKGATAWYTKGKRGYWCQDCQDDWVQKNASGYTTPTTTTTTSPAATPTSEAARQSSTVPWSSFESDAAKGHRENMESDRKTRDVLALLVTAIDQARQALVDLRLELEAKR